MKLDTKINLMNSAASSPKHRRLHHNTETANVILKVIRYHLSNPHVVKPAVEVNNNVKGVALVRMKNN